IGQIRLGGAPPYRLSASTESPRGQSTRVEQGLRCPTTADTVRGCLNGIVLKPHAVTIPSPILALRGVTAAALARSMNDVFAWDPHPHANRRATCRTTPDCRVPFDDPLRCATGVARYRLHGEHVAGCWLGTL